MVDENSQIARMLRGYKRKIDNIESRLEPEGVINFLRSASDKSTTNDSISITVNTGATFDADVDRADGDGLKVTGSYTVSASTTEEHVHVLVKSGGVLTVDGELKTNEVYSDGKITVNGELSVGNGLVEYVELVG